MLVFSLLVSGVSSHEVRARVGGLFILNGEIGMSDEGRVSRVHWLHLDLELLDLGRGLVVFGIFAEFRTHVLVSLLSFIVVVLHVLGLFGVIVIEVNGLALPDLHWHFTGSLTLHLELGDLVVGLAII
jgi:hypothetical protein